MIKKLLYYLSVTVVIVTMAACSSSRRLGRTPTIGGLSGTDYMEKVISQTPQWQNITAKAALNLDMGTKGNAKVNATLRIRRGEVIRLSVAPLLGIEVARMDITPDNVLLIDRLNKRYVKVSFAELSRLANAELDFDVLQSLFMNELFLPGKAQLTANDVTKFRITSEGEQRPCWKPNRGNTVLPFCYGNCKRTAGEHPNRSKGYTVCPELDVRKFRTVRRKGFSATHVHHGGR